MRRAALAILPSALLLASCAGSGRDPFAIQTLGRPAWPAAPDPPRVAHVMSITRHQDLFEPGGFAAGLSRVFGGDIDSRLVRPYALAIYPDRGLLVTDPGAGCVHFFDWKHRQYVALGAELEGGLPSPMGVAVTAEGDILVADSRRAAIERFDTDGESLGRFAPDHKFLRPAGLAVDPANGDVYAADVLAHAVCVFSADGILRRTIGGQGAEPGKFNFPTHIALGEDGNLIVADSMNFRIQRVSPQGVPLSSYGRPGDARGNFARAKGVAGLTGGTMVAVEGLYDSLVFFDTDGNLLLALGNSGSADGEFWLPAGLAVDAGRRLLFVADSYNSRVQVFRILDSAATVPATATPGATAP